MPDLLRRNCVRVAGLVLAGALLLTHHAQAQPAAQPTPQWEAPELSLAEQTARAIQRLALLELRMQPSPSPADYEIAYRTLELARDLTPDDVELARKLVAAAWGTGDGDLLFDATRELVRLDPADTVAQLRLINATIARRQTVEERLALYQRFVGEAGARLDPSIRSRLALDAALLLREQGDDRAFVAMLDRALALDGTNKAAAQLAVTYYGSRVDDPVGRLEMVLNLLYADPVDPNVYFSIARELAAYGVMDQCQRFLNHATALYQKGGAVPRDLEQSALAIRWQVYGPQAMLDALESSLAALRQQQQRTNDLQIANGAVPEDLTPPGTVRLSPERDQIRLLAAMAVGNAETAVRVLADLEASIVFAVGQLQNAATRPPSYTEATATEASVQMLAGLQVYRLWSGIQIDQARRDYDQLRENALGFSRIVDTIDPWILLRDEKPADALARLDELGDAGGPLREIARAIALERLGRTDEAIEHLRALGREDPFDPAYAWGRTHAAMLFGGPLPPEPEARAMSELARGVPRFIDDMIEDTSTFMSLQIRGLEGPTRVNQPWKVRLRLRNLAPIPLAVGSDRPINSRIMLQPVRDRNFAVFHSELYPEVVELNRRLRLMPRESIDAEISVDLGATGVVLALNSLNNHRLRWRAIQGFVIGNLDTFRPGPMCQSAESAPVELLANPAKFLSAQEVGVTIRTSTDAQLPDMTHLARSLLMAWPLRAERPEAVVTTLQTAVPARFQTANPLARAFMIATLPALRIEPAMSGFDASAIALIAEPGFRGTEYADLIEALVLLTRVSDPDSPLLPDAEANATPPVAAIARLVRERLIDGRPSFARALDLDDWFPSSRPPAATR